MTSDAQAAFGAPPEKKRASTAGYWLAGLVGLLAVGGAIAWFAVGLLSLFDAVDELARVPIPGSAVVQLDKGRNAMYFEGGDHVPKLDIRLRRVDGEAVPIGPHGGDVTYDVDGHAGQSIAGFTAPADGRYRVTVEGPEGGTLALGKGVGGRIVGALVGALVIFFGGLLLCGVLIILTARRRKT